MGKLYYFLEGKEFVNELSKPVPKYDFRTKYAELYGGENGYILRKNEVLDDIKKYVNEEKALL